MSDDVCFCFMSLLFIFSVSTLSHKQHELEDLLCERFGGVNIFSGPKALLNDLG